jgi:hypothetical protein
LDLVGDGDSFAELAALEARGVTGINFALQPSVEPLGQRGHEVRSGRILAPPVIRISLDDVPAVVGGKDKRRPVDRKMVTIL